ncbi:MAG: (Fe-S)-binding protein [Deltaproteobacteria bacterium]|nr:(Fe-S)-binding protein [Deltaproteobacteria bacterium]
MSKLESLIFAILLVFGLCFFLRNVFRLFAIVCLGRWENRFDHLWSRFKGMFLYAFVQLRVVSEKFGINHFLLFWGFMLLLLVNAQFFIAGVFPLFSFAFLGTIPYGIMLFLADIMSLVVLVSVIISVIRRVFFRPPHIEPTLDAFFILSLVASLMVAYFGLHACEIQLGEDTMVSWIPISHALSNLFATTAPETTHLLARIFWWIHALVLLFFINYLPYSKHLHILTAIPNCFFRSFSFVTTVPRMVFKKGLTFGTSKVVQFSWKDLFDFLSCTECGRCEAACPAHNTDKPLNPRQVIHEGKLNLLANGKVILSSRPADTLASAPQDASMAIPLINGREESVSTDAIWACTTCGACMVKCPVFIEHVPKIVEMRRHLVMEKADFTEELIGFFENSEQRFNPWGIAPTDRAKWAQELDVKILADGAEVEYLFYVGCAGAFDSRNRQVTTAVTTILNAANLSWGILGTEEKCCGDSLRRLGNEYVFDQLVRDNIEIFKKYGIKKIITYCPHCFNTLKNDYKQFGADFEVIHHTQLIHSLIKQGKITLKGSANGRTVIHDSCYLGRYNEIYKEPREILKEASQGTAPLEMERGGQESFCCGAGGGRMWMEELIGKRIYLERTQEALKTNPSTIAVSCPYCMTMFEDGVKDEKAQDDVKVKDIAEIVVESMT